jgi:hypothetical protein
MNKHNWNNLSESTKKALSEQSTPTTGRPRPSQESGFEHLCAVYQICSMEEYNNWDIPTKLKAEWWHWWYGGGEGEGPDMSGGTIPGEDGIMRAGMRHKSQSSNPNTYKAQYMPNQTRIQEAFQKGYLAGLNEQASGGGLVPQSDYYDLYKGPHMPGGSDHWLPKDDMWVQGQAQANAAPVAYLAPKETPPPTQNDPTWNGYPTRTIDGITYYWWEGYGPNQNIPKWRSRRPRV